MSDSALNGWNPSRGSIAEALQALKLHVPAVQAPFVALLEQHGADQARTVDAGGLWLRSSPAMDTPPQNLWQGAGDADADLTHI